LAADLDAATWLETVKELRSFGWRVTLVAAGPDGCHQIRGVEVLCIPRPDIYLVGQLAFHGRVLSLIMRQWTTVDVILFDQMSAPWLLPLRILRGLTAQRRPLMVMDIRSMHMPGKQTFKDRLRGVFVGIMSRAASRCVAVRSQPGTVCFGADCPALAFARGPDSPDLSRLHAF
jgi:hypothetical protein